MRQKKYVYARKSEAENISRMVMSGVSDNFSFDDYEGHIVDSEESEAMMAVGVSATHSKTVVAIEDVTVDGTPVTPFVVVRLKSEKHGREKMFELADSMGLESLGKVSWDERTYFFMNNNVKTNVKTIDIANYMYENGDFEYAEPLFDSKLNASLSYAPSDPGYASQWNYSSSNGINILPAWAITRGSSNIKLVISDFGFDHSSPEFVFHCDGISLTDENWEVLDGLGLGYHGSAVASIAAASHNDYGLAGVCPNAKLIDLASNGYVSLYQVLSRAYQFNPDVINCSWNMDDSANTVVVALLDNLIANGRDIRMMLTILITIRTILLLPTEEDWVERYLLGRRVH